MADTKTSALTAATTVDPADLVMTVDVSDTSMAASGTNKKATREQLQTYAAGTLTTDKKVADFSATWNNGAVAFTGVKVAITDTASDAASAIADLQVGGSSKFKVGKDGAVTAAAGVSGTTLTSTVSTGTAPLTVASTTAVTNLNADLLDGNHAAAFVTSASLGTGVGTALAVNTGSAGAFVVNGGALGTPSSGTLTNATGLPVSTGVSGLGTGVATALAVNTGSAGAVVVNGGALGTPSSGTLTNATGLPVSTGVSGLGTGVATALAVNTGSSGAVVVNGGALGTPSSGTVTNLTGTASININGTVGATTANTGAFTTLSATGVATFSAGTAAAPAITTSGDTNNGIYFPAADNVAITTGGTQRVLVDSSGNVGIGTSSPGDKLTVSGAGSTYINVASSNAGSGSGLFTSNQLNSYLIGAGAASGGTGLEFRDVTNSATRMLITSSGNVGIGTSSPSEKLHVVASTSTGTAGIRVDGQYGSGYFGTYNNYPAMLYDSSGLKPAIYYDTNNNYLICWTNNTERMRIDSSGNVQVGTSSQLYSSKLTVEAGTANATTYTTVATKGGSSMAHQQQSTTGVSTSLVTILTPGTGPYAAFCVVFGSDGTNRFIDLVLFSVGTGTINVISSLSAAGSPAARTYAQNSSTLQLSMGSGTYTVQVTTIGMGS